jgi:hypothetical protein
MVEIMFFLGAGASIHAGLKGVVALVDDFLNYLGKETNEYKIAFTIVGLLQEWKKDNKIDREIDLEILLEAIEKLENIKHDYIKYFFKDLTLEKTFELNQEILLSKKLKEFLINSFTKNLQSVEYLKPMLDFLDHKPLDIFSTNYDVCIEKLCSITKKICIDGFDESNWNLDIFNKKRQQINLYKLHGSVTWFRNEKGEIKKNVMFTSDNNKTEMISGEEWVPLILYPGKKLSYFEPVIDLLSVLKTKTRAADYCFVIGYSFKDDHLVKLFKYASEINNKLIIFLISPSAYSIYNNDLRDHKDDEIIKSFDGRSFTQDSFNTTIATSLESNTICLPYKIEKISNDLKRQYLMNLIDAQQIDYDEFGSTTNEYLKKVNLYLECEYLFKIDSMLNQNRRDNWRIIEIYFKYYVISLIHKDNSYIHKSIEIYNEVFNILNLDNFSYIPRVGLSISFHIISLELKFNEQIIDLKKLKQKLSMINAFIDKKILFNDDSNINNTLTSLKQNLNNLINYISDWENGITFQDYFDEVVNERDNFRTLLNEFLNNSTEIIQQQLSNLIHRNEENKLRDVINALRSEINS